MNSVELARLASTITETREHFQRFPIQNVNLP